jgi:predicted polyphosphate/ATP-dependent NAD kinase
MARAIVRRIIATGDGTESRLVLELDGDAASTVLFALDAYKKSVLSTVEKSKALAEADGNYDFDNVVEDEMFCYEVAAKCAEIMYGMRWDVGGKLRDRVQKFYARFV